MKSSRAVISLRAKIFFIVSSLLVFVIINAAYSYDQISKVSRNINDISTYIIPITNQVDNITVHILEQELAYERVISLYSSSDKNNENIGSLSNYFNKKNDKIDQEFRILSESVSSAIEHAESKIYIKFFEEIEDNIKEIEDIHNQFYDYSSGVLYQLYENKSQEVDSLYAEISNEYSIDPKVKSLNSKLNTFSLQTAAEATEDHNRIVSTNIILTIIAVILGSFFSSIFIFSLIKPIKRLNNAMNKVGRGEYDIDLNIKSRDELALLSDSFKHMAGELKLKDDIKTKFGKYLDPRIVDNLINNEIIDRDGVKQNMTVLFCEISGIERIIDRLEPQNQVVLLNKYLTFISRIIEDCKGVLDKYMDTNIMAFWGPPFNSEEEHTFLACEALFILKERIDDFKNSMDDQLLTDDDFIIECGLSTGPLVVGNMGSDQSKSYTVLGNTVNTASRLKGASKFYGIPFCINSEAMDKVRDKIICREVDRVMVLGKDEAVTIYEPLYKFDDPIVVLEDLNKYYQHALLKYRDRKWDESLQLFEKCLTIIPDDNPSKIFIDRINSFKTNEPDKDWDMVWTLTKK